MNQKYILYSLILIWMSFFFTQKDIEIEIITTNDIHGAIPPQKAWFINPSFPPDIIGGSSTAIIFKSIWAILDVAP